MASRRFMLTLAMLFVVVGAAQSLMPRQSSAPATAQAQTPRPGTTQPGAGAPRPSTPRPGTVTKTVTANELIVTGGEEVSIVLVMPDEKTQTIKRSTDVVWSWKSIDRKEMNDRAKALFKMISECKPLDHGRRFLITAKEGGVAVVNRQTKRVEFYAQLQVRAYSGDLLPDNRIVIVGTNDKEGTVLIYDLGNPDAPVFKDTLPSAHGAYWDKDAKILWALGWKELRAYTLLNWSTRKPELELLQSFPLAGKDGHDIAPIPGTTELYLTMDDGVWLFDTKTKRFKQHPIIGTHKHIKSVSVHPESKMIAYVQPQGDIWWTNKVSLLGESDDLLFPTAKVYKARWSEHGQTVVSPETTAPKLK